MKIIMSDGLPTVSLQMEYEGKKVTLENILLDTGCSTTILDIDEVEEVGLIIDPINGMPRRMYGVGGASELCYEQKVQNLNLDGFYLKEFYLQLGITKETYGFNGILGIDFMLKTNMIVDFNDLSTSYK